MLNFFHILPCFFPYVPHIHARVHEFSGTANGQTATSPTFLFDSLGTGSTSFVPNLGVPDQTSVRELPKPFGSLALRLVGSTPQAATVAVCRFLVANESAAGRASCQDGLDNDW